jgi:hypothetical protein
MDARGDLQEHQGVYYSTLQMWEGSFYKGKDCGGDGKNQKWKEMTSGWVGMCHDGLIFAVLNKTISLPMAQWYGFMSLSRNLSHSSKVSVGSAQYQ